MGCDSSEPSEPAAEQEGAAEAPPRPADNPEPAPPQTEGQPASDEGPQVELEVSAGGISAGINTEGLSAEIATGPFRAGSYGNLSECTDAAIRLAGRASQCEARCSCYGEHPSEAPETDETCLMRCRAQ